MRRTRLSGPLILALTAFIWGTAFVAQSIGMRSIGPFTYTAFRSLFAVLILFPFVALQDIYAKRRLTPEEKLKRKESKRLSLKSGFFIGLALCLGANLQQFAFLYTSSGKIAFITALYMVIVPVLGIFLGKRVRFSLWIAVGVALAGLYLLSFTHGIAGVNFGDMLTLLSAFAFGVHILLIDRFAGKADPLLLSGVQFLVTGVISTAGMFIFESPSPAEIGAAIVPLLYSGVMSSGVAYTLQIVGQKNTEPTVASLIMCSESVFGVLAAMVILKEIPTLRETAGIVLMLAAVILAQFSTRRDAPAQSASET